MKPSAVLIAAAHVVALLYFGIKVASAASDKEILEALKDDVTMEDILRDLDEEITKEKANETKRTTKEQKGQRSSK